MKYIESLREGTRVSTVYLCRTKQTLLTKTGKEYFSLLLQDKTGTVDGKIWDPGNPGIGEFDAPEYVAVDADVTMFSGKIQLNVRRIRKADPGEYSPAACPPASERSNDAMVMELKTAIETVKDPNYRQLLRAVFIEDQEFLEQFRSRSAAKTVHHSFIGGLLEHTLSVTRLCEYYCRSYPYLKHDLLITAALCHDIGKVKELSAFPENDYTDEGQLLGHIVMGCEMLGEKIRKIPGFPEKKAAELRHCILAHHGELEYGSPKKPALVEAAALNLADNTDAKLETFREALCAPGAGNGWLGFNRYLDSNIRKSTE